MSSEQLQILKKATETAADKPSYCLPAIIESFDISTQTANVKLAVQEKQNITGEYYNNDDFILPDVRVVFYGVSKDCFISLPVKKGTTGVLFCADMDIDNFMDSDGNNPVNAISERRHDITDCFFVPGLNTDKNIFESSADNLRLKNNKMIIELSPDGKIKMQGTTDEVMQVLINSIGFIKDAIDKIGTSNCIDGAPLSNSVAILAAAASLDVEKIKLEGLKL